ncbi:unnamed protein product, partial [Mycena citricolor]
RFLSHSPCAMFLLPVHLDHRDLTGHCDPDLQNCRSLLNIVRGCLTTIAACVWVSVHPNLPAPNQGRIRGMFTRVKVMLIAIAMPEAVIVFPVRQFFAARAFSKTYHVSMTHGFFFTMGGFIDAERRSLLTSEDLERPGVLKSIREVREEDIRDKSKADALAKAFAILQASWFIMQCVARVLQRLPLTQIEIATLAFALLNIVMWLFWWHKPLGVNEGIIVEERTDITGLRKYEPIRPSYATSSLDWFNRFIDEMVGALGGDYEEHQRARSVPAFWSGEGAIEVPLLGETDLPTVAVVTEAISALIFGASHCTAWNTHFPTAVEMWLWRVCSIIVGLGPGTMAVSLFVDLLSDGKRYERLTTVLFYTPVMLYPIARPVLIILMLTTLRSLPSEVLFDVDWTGFIPHIA